MNCPLPINNGVISAHEDTCIACGNKADYYNVLGAFCINHKDNFVREFHSPEDLKFLDIVQNQTLRQHLKQYISSVWKLS